MNWSTTFILTTRLLSLVIFVQAAEILYLFTQNDFKKIFSYQNLQQDLRRGLPLPNLVIDFLFADRQWTYILLCQCILALSLFIAPSLSILCIAFLIHLLVCIRFRGTFNGGSDMMTFVVLTGLILSSYFGDDPRSTKYMNLGFIYITIHLLYSYFKAGWVKIKQPDWQQGTALAHFLQRSLFQDMGRVGLWLSRQPKLGKILCWSVCLFELAVVGLLFFPQFAIIYFGIAFVFHFFVYLAFGLNRFFWVWTSAWPAALFTLRHLQK